MLKERVKKSGSQAAWARENGFSSPYVHDVLNFRRGISDSILAALGLERVVTYRKVKETNK